MIYSNHEQNKDSNISWLNKIPTHWSVKRLRFVLTTNSNKSSRLLQPDSLVSFVPMDAVSEQGELRLDIEKRVDEIGDGYTYFEENNVVVAKITPCFENGKGALARGLKNGQAFGTTELYVLRTFKNLLPEYLFYLTISYPFRKTGEAEMYGAGGQKRIPENFIKNFMIGIPPLLEQKAIAMFLDKKTAEIDTLIIKKQALLTLLTEKRAALITQAVTKGFNPNISMKDSDVLWLGKIPETWRVVALKHYLSTPVTDGPHETPEFLDEGIPFISAEAIKDSKINFDKKRGFISKESSVIYSRKYKPQRGDIYIVKSGATTGSIAMVNTDEHFNIWSPLAAVRANPTYIYSNYLFYFLSSENFKIAIELGWSFGTQQNIGMNIIENLQIVIPPLSEQKEIVLFLAKKMSDIDEIKVQYC